MNYFGNDTRINTEIIIESTYRCKYPSALFFITEASKCRWTRIDMLCIIIDIGRASCPCVSPWYRNYSLTYGDIMYLLRHSSDE